MTPRPNALLPQQLTITGLADGVPTHGLMVLVTLRMYRKNDYDIVVGPTDRAGKVVVTRPQIEKEVGASLRLFPSDYEPLTGGHETGFAHAIEVGVMGYDDLVNALDAYRDFNQVSSYPTGYDVILTDAYSRLRELSPREVSAEVGGTSLRKHQIAVVARHTPLVRQLEAPRK
jgi:hypothetical protein